LALRKTQFPPTRSDFSKQSNSIPRCASALTAAMPDEPAPTTHTESDTSVIFAHGVMVRPGMNPEDAEVKAAGGVVRREDGNIAIVHRPRYDDWSLPKGKLDPGESWEDCAVREVWEETGLRCELGEELSPTFYDDRKGRAKAVRYWLMTPTEDAEEFEPNEEVDELRWLPASEATELLTYEHDIDLAQEVSDL
jgi:8-oxo-dGTP diphosphatase